MDRYDRLEDKIDKVKDDVTDVKVDIAEVKTMVKTTNEIMNEHIAGDNKIINQLAPILDELGSMVQDYTYNKIEKEKRKEERKTRNEQLKTKAIKLGIVGTTISILVGVAKLMELF